LRNRFGDGGTVRLPRIVGQGRALEIILAGRKVPAKEALSLAELDRAPFARRHHDAFHGFAPSRCWISPRTPRTPRPDAS